MSKITLNDLANLQNEASAVSTFNANNTLVETAMENTLSRDGTSPNQMGADFDMNSHRILNLPAAVDPTEPVRLAEFEQGVPGPAGPTGPQGGAGVQGPEGPQGIQGPIGSFAATSTTSLLIGTGSKVFTTQAGLPYTAGHRARASSAALVTNFMDGQVTSYTGTTLTINVTKIGGSGTFADWNINLSGEPGIDGAGTGDVVGPASATDNAVVRFDSTTGKLIQNSAVTIADTTGLVAGSRFANTGLKLEDTNASHLLTVVPGSDLTADRTFTLTTGDAARTLDISAGNVTVSTAGAALIDDASAAAQRATLGVDSVTLIGDTNYSVLATDRYVTLNANLTANRTLTLPALASVNPGHEITFQYTTDSGFFWILDGNGAETINNVATFTLANAWQAVTIVNTNASGWATKVAGLTQGGTGAITASAARTNLGLAIGTNVQAFDAQLFSNIPQNSQSTGYTLVLTDGSKHILHPTSDNNARTFTIPANASVAYPIGTAITFVNQINVLTIAITTDTLTLAGSGATGSRTLAASGVATALKVASTSWIISGTGLT